jgi:hypothetical protein
VNTITLLNTETDSNLQTVTNPDKYIPKYKVPIAKWKAASIIDPSTSHPPVNMFFKPKPNGEIGLSADLVPCNKITVKDHETILNQTLILRILGRAKYHFTINLADATYKFEWNQIVRSTIQSKCPLGSFHAKLGYKRILMY